MVVTISSETKPRRENEATKERIALDDFSQSLKTEISKIKGEIIKWMFVFSLGQIAVIATLVF